MIKIRARGYPVIATFLLIEALCLGSAQGAENATGIYLLGARGSLAGVLPPPGIYVQNDLYHYNGDTGGSRALAIGGLVVADVNAEALIDLATATVVTPEKILGGNWAVAITVPFGHQDVSAGIDFNGPGGRAISLNRDDTATSLGDLYMSTFIGWESGMAHWLTGVSVNAPTGPWQPGRLANIAFHRWAVDTYGAFTWLDTKNGYDLSATAGVTFNGENDDTDYETGTELHLEAALTKRWSNGLSLGLASYHYQQLTGDSGAGARLGDFKGRVTGIGPTVGYQFTHEGTPISTSLKFFKEFASENRLENGLAALFTVSFPLEVLKQASSE